MNITVQTEEDAIWKQRYYVSSVGWVLVARRNPERAVAVADKNVITPRFQLLDMETGAVRPLLASGAGASFLLSKMLAPNGEHLYYLQDEKGNEFGTFMGGSAVFAHDGNVLALRQTAVFMGWWHCDCSLKGSSVYKYGIDG